MALIQLIYVSTARRESDSTELDKLLESCCRHHAEQDITGMLLYISGSLAPDLASPSTS